MIGKPTSGSLYNILIILTFVSSLISCKKESTPVEKNDTIQNKITQKREIADPASKYDFFEFTEDGSFIVVEKETGGGTNGRILSGKIFTNSLF